MNRRTIQIKAPHFTAGIVLDPETLAVVEFAPIVKYMRGWTEPEVLMYCAKKKWEADFVKEKDIVTTTS